MNPPKNTKARRWEAERALVVLNQLLRLWGRCVVSSRLLHNAKRRLRQWEPLPPAALAKAFLVIMAEDVSDGKFAARIIGISLNALHQSKRSKGYGKERNQTRGETL